MVKSHNKPLFIARSDWIPDGAQIPALSTILSGEAACNGCISTGRYTLAEVLGERLTPIAYWSAFFYIPLK